MSSKQRQRGLRLGGLGLALAACVVATGCDEASDGSVATDIEFRAGGGTFSPIEFGDNPGDLAAYLYVPSTAPTGPAPLVVAMHACSQNATAYRAAGWEELADEMGFFVLYPETNADNNPISCFNWAGEYGDETNLRRGEGENASIINMVDGVKAAHEIDEGRVYATGHSAGAAEVALMLATWPDVFAGGGIFAGVPYRCGTTQQQAYDCMSPGIDKQPTVHADLVRNAYPGFTGSYPKLSIWHGTSDFFVTFMNQQELLEQWAGVHGIDMTADVTETVGQGERSEYHDADGNALIETWVVNGGGHSTFNAPSEGCGSAGLYFEDKGLCGPRYMAEFWALGEPTGGDTGAGTDGGDDSSDGSASGGGDSGASGGGDGGSSGGDAAGSDGSDGGDGGDSAGSGGTGGQTGEDEAGEPDIKGVGQCSVTPRPFGGTTFLAWLGLAFAWTRRRRRV